MKIVEYDGGYYLRRWSLFYGHTYFDESYKNGYWWPKSCWRFVSKYNSIEDAKKSYSSRKRYGNEKVVWP